MGINMIDQADIERLFALDPSDPEQAVRLRFGIAKLAGYDVRFFFQRTDWHEDGWVLYHGDYAVEGAHVYTDEMSAWRDCPPFESSLDAALTLLTADRSILFTLYNVSYADGRPYTFMCSILDEYGQDNWLDAETPAWAVCKAWLHYKKSVSARQRARET